MSKETKMLDKWFGEHFEFSFVGGDKKENKKLSKKITKKLKEDIIKGDKWTVIKCTISYLGGFLWLLYQL